LVFICSLVINTTSKTMNQHCTYFLEPDKNQKRFYKKPLDWDRYWLPSKKRLLFFSFLVVFFLFQFLDFFLFLILGIKRCMLWLEM
jgi:hypothetical protein